MASNAVTSQANSLRIIKVEKCFGANGKPLRKPGRVLKGEGVLNKVCRKVVKPRIFFLFNDILVYGSIAQEQQRYTKQTILNLEGMQFRSLDDTPKLKHAWVISTPSKSFTVCAASPREKAQWLDHLTKAANTTAATSGDDQRFEGHAPNWVPDTEADVCMHCMKTTFNAFKRRHHCRSCGNVVCGPCSTKKLVIASQGSKPARVCDACFDKNGGVENATQQMGRSDLEDSDDDDEDGHNDASNVSARDMEEATQALQDMAVGERMNFYAEGDGDIEDDGAAEDNGNANSDDAVDNGEGQAAAASQSEPSDDEQEPPAAE